MAGGLAPGAATAQAAARKALVPHGWLIGAALTQRRSYGIDVAAVELVTRQFNLLTPENLLKFQSVQPQPGQFTFDAHPLLWDRQRRPKPAFDDVARVLSTGRNN